MRHWSKAALAGLSLAVAAGPALGQPARASVFTNAQTIGRDGAATELSRFVVSGGAVAGIGDGAQAPPFSKTTDLGGGFVTAGLIDPAGSLGVTDGGADARGSVADGFNAFDSVAFKDAWRQGVTAVFVSPEGAGISGVGQLVRLGTNEDGGVGLFVDDTEAMCVDLDSGSATDRLRTLAEVDARFRAAKAYRETLEIYEEELEEYEKELKKFLEEREKKDAEEDGGEEAGEEADKPDAEGEGEKEPEEKPDEKPEEKKDSDKNGKKNGGENGGENSDKEEEEDKGPEKPDRPRADKASEAVLRVIDNEIPLRVRAHRSADILNAVELADKFNVELIVEGASEAHLVAGALAGADTSVVLGPADTVTRIAAETPAADRAGALRSAGVSVAYGSGRVDGASRFVLPIAQEYRPAAPFAAATSGAARLLGSRSLGRFGPGAAADFVVWDRDPREPGARVRRVYVDGKMVHAGPGEGAG